MLFDNLLGATDCKNALQVSHSVHFAFRLIYHAPGSRKASCRKDRAVEFLVEQEKVGEFLIRGSSALLRQTGFQPCYVFQRMPLGGLDHSAFFQLEPDETGLHVPLNVDRRDVGATLRHDSHETFFRKANDRLADGRFADMQQCRDLLFRQRPPWEQLHLDNQFAK
ncbi:hypothetical protein D3C87_1353420 [compost metagenome]